MTSLLNFIIIYQLVQKFIGGHTHRRTDEKTHRHTQEFDRLSLHFSFTDESWRKLGQLSVATISQSVAAACKAYYQHVDGVIMLCVYFPFISRDSVKENPKGTPEGKSHPCSIPRVVSRNRDVYIANI
jgi:hypothetical protein